VILPTAAGDAMPRERDPHDRQTVAGPARPPGVSDPLPEATVRRMVRLVDPDWTVEDVTTIERGFSRVSRVVVDTGDGRRECILKATPAADDAGTAADARVTAALDSHTPVPVAAILGAVDEHESVPAPFYLAEAVEGRELDYAAVGWFDDDELRALARDTGAALAALHGLDAVDAFGHVWPAPASRLTGGRPDGSLDALAVTGGTDSWPTMVRGYADRELDRHADSRFGDLTPRLRDRIDGLIDGLEGSFEPALCRNDHGLHNVLVGSDGGVAAMLDWAYTLATPPAFDVEFAVYIYGGAYIAGVPGVRDRREAVREALLAGYRATAPDRVDAVAERNPLYELLAATRLMNDFHNLPPELPDGTADAAAERLRTDVATRLAADEPG
jgi:aminoglycoside phosphotransferase (APT) family kinase protein